MRVVLELQRPTAPQIPVARDLIQAGGVMIYPTDTFYGLGADPFQPAALEKIFHIKHRETRKPILVLISDVEKAGSCAQIDVKHLDRLIEAFWPGPLTIVLPSLDRVPLELTAGTGKIGIRLPGSAHTREIVRECGGVLTGTSANLSGEENASHIEMIADEVISTVDLVIDAGETAGRVPSTLIDLTGPRPRILREGAIPKEDIERALGLPLAEG